MALTEAINIFWGNEFLFPEDVVSFIKAWSQQLRVLDQLSHISPPMLELLCLFYLLNMKCVDDTTPYPYVLDLVPMLHLIDDDVTQRQANKLLFQVVIAHSLSNPNWPTVSDFDDVGHVKK